MRTRVLVLVGLVVVAAIVGFGGLGDHAGQRVLCIGDSITYQSQDQVRFALGAAGWDPTIDGRSGAAIVQNRFIVDWHQDLERLVPEIDPDIVVVELGTNDDHSGGAEVARGIDAVMEPLRKVPRVVWANVKTGFRTEAAALDVNEQLLRASVRWPNLEVLDMAAHFADHPEWVSDDGVHLSDAGKVEFARLVVRALASPPSRVGALSPVR